MVQSRPRAPGLRVTDDRKANRLRIREQYEIPDMWKPSEETGHRTITVHPYQLYAYVGKPSTLRRATPLALAYPLFLEHRITVHLHEPWPVAEEDVAVENPAFTYTSSVRSADGRRVVVTSRLRTHRDHVPPSELQQYIADLEKVEADLGLVFATPGTGETAGVDWRDILRNTYFQLVLAIVLAASILGAKTLYLHDPEPAAQGDMDLGLRGVAGWLVLLALNVYLAPLGGLLGLAMTMESYGLSVWRTLAASGSQAVLLVLLSVFELAVNVGGLVFSILLILLFRGRRHTFPRLFVAINLAWALAIVVDLVAGSILLESYAEAEEAGTPGQVQGLVAHVAWCLYVSRSKRVRATFTARRAPVHAGR